MEELFSDYPELSGDDGPDSGSLDTLSGVERGEDSMGVCRVLKRGGRDKNVYVVV